MALQHLRSSTAHKRPIPTVMSAGQIAINTNEASPGLFFKDSNGDLVKVGPVHIGPTAPNSSPASVAATALVTGTVYQILTVGTSDFTLVGASANTVGTIFTATGTTTGTGTVSGQQGVEKGEQWLDTTGGTYVLKIYDGSAWRSESGTFVDVSGDTMTGALLLDNAASASAPDLSFDGDADTGIYSPGANQVAVATNGSQRLLIQDTGLTVNGTTTLNGTTLSLGAEGGANGFVNAPESIYFNIDSNNSETGKAFVFAHNAADQTGSELFKIQDNGSVGIGTSSPDGELDVTGTGDANGGVLVVNDAGVIGVEVVSPQPTILLNETDTTDENYQVRLDSGDLLIQTQTDARTGASTKVTIDSSGKVGIGTTSPAELLHVNGSSAGGSIAALVENTNIAADSDASINLKTYSETWRIVSKRQDKRLDFVAGSNLRASFDNSGRFLVGTSSARSIGQSTECLFQIEGTDASVAASIIRNSNSVSGPVFSLGKSRGTTSGSSTIVQDDDNLGVINFAGADGTDCETVGARIAAQVDGTPGANDMPTRLVFSVTADGSASPSEAMRINNAGELLVGYTSDNGAYKLQVNSQIFATSATIATSDGRYKENVASLDGCVDLVKALRPVSFDWKAQEPITRVDEDGETVVVREAHNFPDGKQVGFIAQEVEEVLADKPWLGSVIKQNVRPAVTDNDGNKLAPEEEFLGIAEGNLVAVLTSALKDAIGRIESLEAEVAALKA